MGGDGQLKDYVHSSPAWGIAWRSSHGAGLSLPALHCSLQQQQQHEQLRAHFSRLRSFGSSLDLPALMISGLDDRSIRPAVSNHLRHTCVTGDDRSYSKHVLLCIAFWKSVMQALQKLSHTPICI